MRECDKLMGGIGEDEISYRSDLVCPFCGEQDFDKPGLKYHLETYCDEYKNVEVI